MTSSHQSRSSPDFIDEISFESASDFLAALSPLTPLYDFEGYIFRGHSDDSYDLIPTSIRLAANDDLWRISGIGKPIDGQSDWEFWQSTAEYAILREFFKVADQRGLSCQNPIESGVD